MLQLKSLTLQMYVCIVLRTMNIGNFAQRILVSFRQRVVLYSFQGQKSSFDRFSPLFWLSSNCEIRIKLSYVSKYPIKSKASTIVFCLKCQNIVKTPKTEFLWHFAQKRKRSLLEFKQTAYVFFFFSLIRFTPVN